MPDDPLRPPACPSAGTGDEELYQSYVRYMTDARRLIIPLLATRRSRRRFLEIHRLMSREQFRNRLSSIDDDPQRRKQFEEILRAGFAEEPSAEEWATWTSRVG